MARRLLILLLALLLMVSCVSALDVKTYKTKFNYVDDRMVVEVDLLFNSAMSEEFEFELPSDYNGLSVYVDGESVYPVVEENVLNILLDEASRVSFSYATAEFIDKTNFLMNMKLDFDVSNLIVELILPEGATLKRPIKEGDLTAGSIFPKPTKASTDGRSLIFSWLEKDLDKGDELSIFAQIEVRRNMTGFVVLVAGIVLLVLGAGYYFLRKDEKPTRKTEVKVEDRIEKHLKEDEGQIVNVLKRREGRCEQGTLRVVTGFSKATLSRLLKELEDRKVIHKEKRGKKNLVFLRK